MRRGGEYRRCRPSCTNGLSTTRTVDLWTCSTWSTIPLSWLWPGNGRGNRGARTAGVDGVKPRSIVFGEHLLAGLRDDLKAERFTPLPVREKLIPKKGGKFRGLGIPAARDRVAQAALLLVLEPIFEADFKPCSYGFRPKRRAHDAIAEIQYLAQRSYEWVVEGDIKACFDEISHVGLMDRLRARIGDKRVLRLIKAFLKAGV